MRWLAAPRGAGAGGAARRGCAPAGVGSAPAGSPAALSDGQVNAIVFVIAGAMFFCNVHRVLTSVLAVPIAEQFGFSMVEMGFLQSSFLWGYGLNQIPSGVLSDRYGGVVVMLTGLLLWSLATSLVPLVTLIASDWTSMSPSLVLSGMTAGGALQITNRRLQLMYLIASRCMMGIASAVALPAVSACTSRIVDASRRGGTLSLIYAAFNTGTAMGLVGIPLLCERVGWERTFALLGVLGMVSSALAAASLWRYLGVDDRRGARGGMPARRRGRWPMTTRTELHAGNGFTRA